MGGKGLGRASGGLELLWGTVEPTKLHHKLHQPQEQERADHEMQ